MPSLSSDVRDGTEAVITTHWGGTFEVWREEGVWVAPRPEGDELDEFPDSSVKEWTAV